MNIESSIEYHLVKNTEQNSALNFEFLRAHGLELLQKYAGSTWTDYNLHDPGVTILEYLCYAITDLAYRSSFSIQDILTEKNGKIDFSKNMFLAKKDILTTNPISVNDFRKLIIDQIPDVHNVWIESLESVGTLGNSNGLYKVQIQPSNNYLFEKTDVTSSVITVENNENLIDQVKGILNNSRNLGCDFLEYQILDPCDIYIEADIVVDNNIMQEELLAQVYETLLHSLNPGIKFYNEASLIEKGLSIEVIYEGPALQHGFILESELVDKITIIDPADLAKAILGIHGVKYLRKLSVLVDGVSYDQKPFYLDGSNYPRFNFDLKKPQIRLYNDNYELPLRATIFSSLLYKKIDADKRKYIKGYSDLLNDNFAGENRNIANYDSFQSLFPPIYKLNVDLIENQIQAKKEKDLEIKANAAKAKQLKGFLMLFEQILANYLIQLSKVSDIISTSFNPTFCNQTYFTQPLYNLPAAGNILADFMKPLSRVIDADWEKFKDDLSNNYVKALGKYVEPEDLFVERKQRLFDHLLSRFNLNLLKYPIQLYKRLYLPFSDNDSYLELKWKADILNNLDKLSYFRNKGLNYSIPMGGDDIGFEDMMRKFLFIQKKPNGLSSAQAFKDLTSDSLLIDRNKGTNITVKDQTYYEVTWEGQRLVMSISQSEIDTLFNFTEKNIDKNFAEDSINNTIVVPKKNFQFLKDGINHDYYKIGPEINNIGFVILYKSPKDPYWLRIGKFDSMDKALKAKNEFVEKLVEISVKTENFYIVEHVLLKPTLESKSFGFEFYDEKGEIVFKHNQWFTFKDRNIIIQKILAVASSANPTKEQIASILYESCTIVTWTAFSESFVKRLFKSLQLSQNLDNMIYPCFKNVVKKFQDSDIEVSEDFFRYRMTIVFPSWPARFQEMAFKQFSETLFFENVSAQMRINVKWLNLKKFEEFEEAYFSWMGELQKKGKDGFNLNATDRLTKLLI